MANLSSLAREPRSNSAQTGRFTPVSRAMAQRLCRFALLAVTLGAAQSVNRAALGVNRSLLLQAGQGLPTPDYSFYHTA